ncbi:MAG: LysR substrate-binding domain-containing protein [Myxococcota bacterium]
MDLNHLRTFEQVAEAGSLAAAARSLGVPTSTVSRHLSRLEEELGGDLLHRGPRTATLTDLGEAVLARSRQPLRELSQIASELPELTPRGTIRIAAPSNLALSVSFASMLVSFRRAYPAVDVDLDFSKWLDDPVESGVDVAFRPFSTVSDAAHLVVRRLPSVSLRLYAATAYLARRDRPKRIEDLRSHEMVAPRFRAGRPLVLQRGKRLVEVEPRVAFVGDDLSFVLAMVDAGAGYAVIPEAEARSRLEAGRLLPLLPGWKLAPLVPAMVWHKRRFMAPRLRVFIDFVAAELGRATKKARSSLG